MKTKISAKTLGKYLAVFIMTYIMLACTVISAGAVNITTKQDNASVSVIELATKNKNDDGWSQINSWIEGLQGNLKTIAYAIAGVAVIILGIVLIGGGGQALQKAKPMAIGILSGVAVISFGVALVSSLAGQ